MRGLGTVLKKDLRLAYRSPTTAVLLVALPLVIIIFVSFALEGLVTGGPRLKLPVVDLDRSATSRALVGQLDEVVEIERRDWDKDEFTGDDAAGLFGGGRRVAVLVIPQGYEAALAAGDDLPLRFYLDPAQRGLATNLRLVVQGQLRATEFVETTVALVAAAAGQPEEQVRPEVESELAAALGDSASAVRELSVTEGSSLPSAFEQTVPGFTLMFSVFLGAMVSTTILYEKQRSGTWYRTLASPVRRPVVVLGILLTAFSLGVVQTTLLFAIGRFAFGMELGSEYVGLALVVLLFQMFPAGLGLLVAGWTDNIVLQSNLFNIGTIFLGIIGAAWPRFFCCQTGCSTSRSSRPITGQCRAFMT